MIGLHQESHGKKIPSLKSPFISADTKIIRFNDKYLKTVSFQLDIKQMFVTMRLITHYSKSPGENRVSFNVLGMPLLKIHIEKIYMLPDYSTWGKILWHDSR